MNKWIEYFNLGDILKTIYNKVYSTKSFVIITLTIFLSVILNGKTRCFSVLAAELQNETCDSVQDTCGMATLNWIAFLSEMIVVGGNPFITNMFIRVHNGVLGGRITYQFCMFLTLGVMLTGFVSDPESLFVTDTIIQGISTSVLLSLVTFKLGHFFPEDHPNHRSALLLTEIAPWLGVILCPLYGLLITKYGWQSSYFLIALLILIVCLLAGLVEPKPSISTFEGYEDDDSSIIEEEEEDRNSSEEVVDDTAVAKSDESQSPNPYTNSDCWEMEDDRGVECQHPRLIELLLNTNISQIVSRNVVIVWFIERALAMMAEYNLIINIVHYMTSLMMDSLSNGSLIMVTLGLGNVLGYLTIFILGPNILKHMTKIYILSSMLLVISFFVWQIYGSVPDPQIFTIFDTHCLIIVIGVFGAITSAQSYYVAEQIIERPRIIAVSLTKCAQALGLLIGPITSGMLIQINYFHSFFITQGFIHSVRILLLAFITFKQSHTSKT